MKKITPDPPVLPLDAADSNDPLLDRAATDRALNYYLHDHKPVRPLGMAMLAIPHGVNSEAALAQASDLLRCAGACANEAGNGLSGPRAIWCCRSCTWWSWPRGMSTSRWIRW